MIPLLLLDVDGVLNAFDRRDERLTHGWAAAAGNSWLIAFDPSIVQRLVEWDAAGRVEVQWLATWGHDANEDLRALLGTPRWPVAGTWDEEPTAGEEAEAGAALAGATPSAPDEERERWWKQDVVRRLLATDPERRIVWIDDELTPNSTFTAWAVAQGRVLPVGPDPDRGLVKEDLWRVEEWLTATADPQSG